MNMIEKFFEGKKLMVITVEDEPRFLLKDVCDILEIGHAATVKKRLMDDVVSNHPIWDSLGRQQEATFVNEDGLYDVVLDSKKKEAKTFRKWITSEVIPSIRKTGSYTAVEKYSIPKTYAEALRLAADIQEENETLRIENEVNKPKATYYDLILQSKSLIAISQIAKDYGMTAQSLNKLLHEQGVQYKKSGQWLLYRKYQNDGYTSSETFMVSEDRSKMNTKWTQKGRVFIHNLLSDKGIKALIDR